MTTPDDAPAARFTLLSRLLHWSMAAMVIAQLLIGVTMVVSLAYYPLLLAIHRPLGVLIGVFAVARLVNRLRHHPPPFESTMSPIERRIATWSERLLYGLLLAQPLVGWALLSAAHYPITLFGPVHLPAIAPFDITLFTTLRWTHLVLATLLFLTFTAHMLAVLFHKLVLGDGVLARMGLWPRPRTPAAQRAATGGGSGSVSPSARSRAASDN